MNNMIDKILIAIDDSPSAMHAADYGIRLATNLGVKIGVICVTKPSMGNIDAGITPVEVEKAMQRRSDLLIDEISITHPEVKFEEFDPIGNPEKEIRNVIALWKPDMLIIGHHNGSFLNTITGNHIEKKLLRHIKIPILIIPEN